MNIFDEIKLEPLIALRDHFKSLPNDYGKLTMAYCAKDVNDDLLMPFKVPECGTSMCLLGHLPLLGYLGFQGEDWINYSKRILNISILSPIGNYLFSCIWSNDIQLAVQRLDDVINKRKSTLLPRYQWYYDYSSICLKYNNSIEEYRN